MAITVWPVDAAGGAPTFSGRKLRQAMSALLGGATSARPLGARSGVRPGSGTIVTVSTTQWTVGPHAGVLDLEASASAGPYMYAVDAAVSGALTAADASNPRVDIVYVTLSDPAESDGSATPSVATGYLAGAAAASPVAPATPARSLVLAQVSVPRSGNGSPAAVPVAPYTNAAGGVTMVNTLAELNALPTHEGKPAFCLFDGSTAFFANGRWVFHDNRRQDYATTWTDNAGSVLNPGTGGNVTASYWRKGAIAAVRISVYFSPTGVGINTGGGGFRFTMPWTLSSAEQEATLLVKAFVPNAGGDYVGSAYVFNSTNQARPLLPYNRAGSAMGAVSNADSTLSTGTGTPLATNLSWYTWGGTNGGYGGGNLMVYGDYPY